MAEGNHISKAKRDEMERRKRDQASRDEDSGKTSETGEREQQADLKKARKDTRIVDPVVTANPD